MLLNLLFMLFFLDEKVLLLPVVYEKYNYLLSMNFNAEIYNFSFTENNINQYLVILPTENIFIPF